ncbi:hypothetical protein [Stenotrophomonas acidaminiphila]|uniref:hypothetical protein n=1 Tax=Stenotrophomonas acidaminiphila TaxID=128780 RepID=UPI0024AD48A6|nr:hypothetical protein [Stenotrophomonas acidaminiphila]WHL20021.1 hypothetical protein QLF99_06275 [Stenotrophomonas acidaminiphila]
MSRSSIPVPLEQDLRNAVELGDKNAVQELLDMGVNPVARDPKTGQSALSQAVSSGDFEMTWLVHSHATSGAKKGHWEAPDVRGLMDQAQALGHDKVGDYLSQFAPVAHQKSKLSIQSWSATHSPPAQHRATSSLKF